MTIGRCVARDRSRRSRRRRTPCGRARAAGRSGTRCRPCRSRRSAAPAAVGRRRPPTACRARCSCDVVHPCRRRAGSRAAARRRRTRRGPAGPWSCDLMCHSISGSPSALATSWASTVLPVPGSPLTSSGRCSVTAALTATRQILGGDVAVGAVETHGSTPSRRPLVGGRRRVVQPLAAGRTRGGWRGTFRPGRRLEVENARRILPGGGGAPYGPAAGHRIGFAQALRDALDSDNLQSVV